MTLNRVAYFPNTGVLRFNADGAANIGGSFAEGGTNREATIWVETASETVSFRAKDQDRILNSGPHWINFVVPATYRDTLKAVGEDNLIIVAVSVPATQ